MDGYDLQNSVQKQNEIKNIEIEKEKQKKDSVQKADNMKGIIGREYDISQRREQLEKEQAASPAIFKMKYKKKKELEDIRKRQPQDILNETVDDMHKEMQVQLDEHGTDKMCSIVKAFEACMEKKSVNDCFAPEHLIKDGVTAPDEFFTLCGMIKKLQSVSSDSFTQAEAKELIEQYLSLDLKFGEANSAYLLKETDKDIPDIGIQIIRRNPQSAYLLLYQCASVALRNILNSFDEKDVDMQNFAELCGISMASTYAAAGLCINNEFILTCEDIREDIHIEAEQEEIRRRNRQKEEAEAEAARILKAEKEREKIVEERAVELHKIIEEDKYKKAWFEDSYETVLKEAMSELFDKRNINETSQEIENEVLLKFNRTLQLLDKKLGDIENYVTEHEELTLGMPYLKAKVCAELGRKIDKDGLFNDVLAGLRGEEIDTELKGEELDFIAGSVDVSAYDMRKRKIEDNIPELADAQFKEFWQNGTVQSMILNSSDNIFDKYVSDIAFQVRENESYARTLINRQLTLCSSEIAYNDIKKQLGSYWFVSSPGVIADRVAEMLAHINIYSPKASAIEKNIKIAMERSQFPSGFSVQVQKYLIEQKTDLSDMDGLVEVLSVCRQSMIENVNFFCGKAGMVKLSSKAWKELMTFETDNICISPEKFRKFLCDKLESFEKWEDTEKLAWNSYLYSDNNKEDIAQGYLNYQKRLAGSDLCEWEGFEGIFSEHKKAVLGSIQKLLHTGKLAETFDFMKKVDNLDMLERLTAAQYRELCMYFQANLGKVVQNWGSIQGAARIYIQNRLLDRMLIGELTPENFDEAVLKERRNQEKQEQLNERRLFYLLGNEDDNTEQLKCNILKVDKKSQDAVVERLDSFRKADGAWDIINSGIEDEKQEEVICSLCQVLITYYNDLKKKDIKDAADYVHRQEIEEAHRKSLRDWMWDTLIYGEDRKNRDNLYNEKLQRILAGKGVNDEKNMNEYLQGSRLIRNAMTAMQKNAGSNKEQGRRYYFLEFTMCGMEKDIFGPGKKFEDVFNGKDDAAYEEALSKLSLVMLSRRRRMNITLDRLFPGIENRQKRSMLKSRLADAMGGLEPLDADAGLTEDMKQRNLKNYGIVSFEELLSRLRYYGSMQGAISDNREINDTAIVGKKRKTALEEYGNNIFRGLVPVLMKDEDVWSHMMYDDDAMFTNYMGELEKRLRPLTNIINKGIYKESTATVRLFVREYQDDILNDNSEQFWTEKMNVFSKMLLEKEAGGKKLEQKLKTAERKYGDELSMRILSAVLRDNESAYEILYGKNAMERVLAVGKSNYDANMEYMKKQIAAARIDMDEIEADKLFVPYVQYMTEHCILKTPQNFQAEYQNWYKDYLEQVEKNKTSDVDITILDAVHKARIEAVNKKTEGIEKEKAVKKIIDDLQNQAYRKCSPILALGDKKEALTDKDINKADEFIEKNYEGAAWLVKAILKEKYLSMKEPDKEQLKKDSEWLITHYELLEKAKSRISDDEDDISRYFMFLYLNDYEKGRKMSGDNADKTGDNGTEDILALYDSYRERKKLVSKAALMEQNKKYGFIRNEIKEIKDCLNIGIYTMPDENFKEFAHNRIQYFESAELAHRIISEEVDKNAEKIGYAPEQVKAGFFEYFRSEILDGISADNEEAFRLLVQSGIEQEHICDAVRDFDSVLGAVSSDSLTAGERQGAAVTRKDFEMKLVRQGDEKLIKQYNELDSNQRKLFALALMIPGQYQKEELLTGAKLINENRGMNEETVWKIKKQIKNYIEHEEFMPDIEYAQAIKHITREDGSVDKDVLNSVMNFTKLCVQQYQYNKPKDWERLNSGTASINEAMIYIDNQDLKRSLKDVLYDRPYVLRQFENRNLSEVQQLKEWLREQAKADNKGDLVKIIDEMDDVRFKKIIVLLQKRSALDTSTRMDIDKYDNFADVRERAEIFEQLKGEEKDDLIMLGESSEFCNQAFLSLCSFQLRDDVDMTGRYLTYEDFAKNVLSRTTLIDWKLFRHALEAEEELNKYTLRIQAVRQAPKLIKESGNKKAIEVYEKYENEDSLTDEQFDNFLETQAKQDMADNDKVAALMAGYYSLNYSQRSLFFRALEHRDILDVSKEDFVAAYLGRAERDYVNPQARDALANEYLRNASSKNNVLKLDNSQKKAMMSLLSRQIDDSLDFKDEKFSYEDKHISDLFRVKRNTAIDWKLFSRALQFVNRTSSEARIMAEDQELYISRGNLAEGGAFKFEGDYLRRNLHSAGNRATHFLGRLAVDTIKEKIPAYDTLQNIMLDVTSNSVRSKIYKYGLAPEKEEKQQTYKKNLTGTIRAVFDAEKEKVESLGIVNTANDVIESVTDFVQTVVNIYKLDSLDEETGKEAEKDEKVRKQAAKRQTKEERELSESGDRRNHNAMKGAKLQTYQHQYIKAIKDVKEVAKSLTQQIGGETVENYTVIADTAIEFASFVHQIFTDAKVMQDYLEIKNEKNPKLTAVRKAYKESKLYIDRPDGLDEYSNRELMQTAMGYESFDELSQAVCLEIIRSLLYSAGEYGTSRANRVQSAMILSVLGFENYIGRQDSDAAIAIYRELAGAKYR